MSVTNNINAGSITVNVNLDVSYDTVQVCLGLLEMYLNNNPTETLFIHCDEAGNWDLGIYGRETGEHE